MPSSIDPDLAAIPEISHEPLDPGTYFLVDIGHAVREYLQVPHEVRMVGVSEGAPYSEVDMLDIELSSIIPCLETKDEGPRQMKEHIENLLDDGKDQIEYQLKSEGVDTESRTILNTHEQLEHAKIINRMGSLIYDTLAEQNMYNENGRLLGEHVTLTDDGLLVLRAT